MQFESDATLCIFFLISINKRWKMFDEKISRFQSLPLDDNDRKKTDILCTIIGALFALTMFILAFVLMNTDHYKQSNFPTDSDWVSCNYGVNANYPFVYFPDIIDINARVCVSRCPNAGDIELLCRPNSKVPACDINNIYSSQVDFTRLGGFCAPLDTASKDRLMKTANLSQKWNFLNIYDCIRISLLIALGMGLLWMILVQCLPRVISTVVTVLAIIAIGFLGIVVISGRISKMSSWVCVVFGLILLGIAVMFACFLCFYRLRNKLINIFLDWSTHFLKDHLLYYLYPFIFIALTVGLIILCMFQHLAYLSNADPTHHDGDIYLNLSSNTPLFILNLVEFVWGLQFLKDSFNFIMSGLAAQWYAKKEVSACLTTKRLLKFHFGSVVGGSFMNAFFNIINFILQSVRCYREGACPLCASCYQTCCGCNRNFFELVRTDVYAYINLTGIAYCNAARNCEYLIQNYHLFVGCQSLLYFYRISAYCFLVGTTIIITTYIQESKLGGNNDFISLVFSCVLSYCLLNYFVDLHANIAEGIQISYLIEESLGQRDKNRPAEVVGDDELGFKYQICAMEKSYRDGQFC